jgi:uncharacterized protein (TIGR02145 family)
MKNTLMLLLGMLLVIGCAKDDKPEVIPTITNGTQFWQSTNLNVATYSDGTVIPEVVDPTQWIKLTTGAWCYYNNDSANGSTYGKLYNWYAVAGIWNEDSKTDVSQRKNLSPIGWHVPTDAEWDTLMDYLGGEAGGKMKETGTAHWNSPNQDATNSSGFTGLPGGYRYGGVFYKIGDRGRFWSSSEYILSDACFRSLYYDGNYVDRSFYNKADGLSVRCVRN